MTQQENARIKHYEIELEHRPINSDIWCNETYVLVPANATEEDFQQIVRNVSHYQPLYEWRIAHDTRGNEDYAFDQYGERW